MIDVVFMTGSGPNDKFQQMLWVTQLPFVPVVGQYVQTAHNHFGANDIFIVSKVFITGQSMRYGIYPQNPHNNNAVVCQVELVK